MNTNKFEKLLTEELALEEQVALLQEFSLDRLTAIDVTKCAYSVLDKADKIPLLDDDAVDLVGTGGDGLNTFNVSTTAAIVAAAAGVKIAKHGNRSITSRSGSFDVLQALNIPVPQTVAKVQQQFKEIGITFLFAPIFHPVLKRLTTARQVLAKQGIKTIFNIIGPLVNPMQVQRQALGVFSPDLIKVYSESLQARDMRKSLVFHGQGMDELTLIGINQVARLVNGKIDYFELDPRSLGFKFCDLDCLAGDTAQANANMTIAILNGEDHTARRDVVLLNAAAAIIVSRDDALSFMDAIAMAKEAIDSGKAVNLLARLRRMNVNTR